MAALRGDISFRYLKQFFLVLFIFVGLFVTVVIIEKFNNILKVFYFVYFCRIICNSYYYREVWKEVYHVI